MLNDFKNTINSKCYFLLIFGSYAKKTITKSSDIDIMLIVPEIMKNFLKTRLTEEQDLCHCLYIIWYSLKSSLKPYLWVVVISYYSMFYIANAVLLELGYKTADKIVHKVTNDALIVLVMDKIKHGLLEEYENAKQDALELASIKSDEIIAFYGLEMDKRSRFQYNMTESIQENKANTSLKRARQFVFEMKKLLQLSSM